ncbi:MAG: dihydropteroate synthase [Verrucomicrobiae bacterium]|nr:dihydropteroate synthase [Verrucomicrobiae bacterium]NNJ86399.1 dihydropteroate synthase [Akkermansiaceae bacterium]
MKLKIIGELINNAYARSRRAWENRDLAGYQALATSQVDHGSEYLDVIVDSTPKCSIDKEEAIAFLPTLIPALQSVTSVPLCFDHSDVNYHRTALQAYDRTISPAPIINSVAVSRQALDEFISLIKEFDTNVIVVASEKAGEHGSLPCHKPEDVHEVAGWFVDKLKSEADITNEQIFIDPGLAPVGADTYGLINVGLDAMKLISNDPALKGCHLVVGLSNFAWGTPVKVRHQLEKAYLTLAAANGLDFVLGNPETGPQPLPADDDRVKKLAAALEEGRPSEGVTQEDAGYDQTEAIMELCEELGE